MSEILGFGLLFLLPVAGFVAWHNRDGIRAWFNREPVRLDAADGIHTHRPAPAKRCSVPFCDDPVQVNLHVGHDWWTFCMAHGLPYLTDRLAS